MGYEGATGMADERLFRSLAEQVKLPMLQIARGAELAAAKPTGDSLRDIQYVADMTLQLIDSYLMTVELQALPTLELEPVSVSAILHDSAHALDRLAKTYHCNIEVRLEGRYGPAMAHRAGLEAAILNLGRSFIEALPEDNTAPRQILLAGHRDNHQRLVAGVFSGQLLSAELYRRAQQLYGRARQTGLTPISGSGAGIFIAESLLRNMSARLRVARHDKLSGLAASLLPSQQLSLL